MSLQTFFKGWVGELKTQFAYTFFLDCRQYHVFNNIIIQRESWSTQIDHIIVSKYGVFVVETKNRSGWIFGNQTDNQWTQVLFHKKYYFQNPLRQNHVHTKNLARLIGIDQSKIYSLINFCGGCHFKTRMPENVLNNKYTGYIKSKKQVLLTNNEVDRICHELQRVKNNTPLLGGWRHVKALKKRYESNTICPKCGGSLKKRIANTGKWVGHEFLGCNNYPECRYIKEL